MKIYGPYKRKDGRKHVIIISDDGTRVTKSYPRYVYENYHGVILEPEITIDHIDGDFTNDNITNLQLLSRRDNIKKSKKPVEWLTVKCVECAKEFLREAKDFRYHQIKKGKSGPFCGHVCAGKHSRRIQLQSE